LLSDDSSLALDVSRQQQHSQPQRSGNITPTPTLTPTPSGIAHSATAPLLSTNRSIAAVPSPSPTNYSSTAALVAPRTLHQQLQQQQHQYQQLPLTATSPPPVVSSHGIRVTSTTPSNIRHPSTISITTVPSRVPSSLTAITSGSPPVPYASSLHHHRVGDGIVPVRAVPSSYRQQTVGDDFVDLIDNLITTETPPPPSISDDDDGVKYIHRMGTITGGGGGSGGGGGRGGAGISIASIPSRANGGAGVTSGSGIPIVSLTEPIPIARRAPTMTPPSATASGGARTMMRASLPSTSPISKSESPVLIGNDDFARATASGYDIIDDIDV
jgi:hypothetical protein